jgi:hypothetical protein
MTFKISDALPDAQQEYAANQAANRVYVIYQQTAMLMALMEKQSIDVNRLFEFNRLNADVFRQLAIKTATDPISSRVNALIAEMHDQFEATVRNMLTVPANAGNA